MPNAEQITDVCKSIIVNNIEAKLAEIDAENGKGIVTSTPVEYFSREIDENMMVNYPACKISYLRFSKVEEYTWRHFLNIEFYQANHNQEELEIQIKRMAAAGQEILEKELNWQGYGHDPRVSDGFISSVLAIESGFLRACRLQFSVDTIEGGY